MTIEAHAGVGTAIDPRRYHDSVADAREAVAVHDPVCLYLETTNRCNLLCTTCPRTYADLEPEADMSWELFTRIVDQVPNIGGVGHQIHHKFVVCGFNGDDPVVFCGSSNLASGGEKENGDNLLAVHDGDVATAFAIEALLLVDHYSFLNRYTVPKSGTAKAAGAKPKKAPRRKPIMRHSKEG